MEQLTGETLNYYSQVFSNIISNEIVISLIIFVFVLIGAYYFFSQFVEYK